MKRAAILLLSVAVLSAAGMPLRLPCCSFRKLAATSVTSDCCPIPGCTLLEREGAAPASIRAGESSSNPLVPVPISMALPGISRGVLPVAPGMRASLSPSPPRARPIALALLSVYRI